MMKREKKAISPLITTILLISIAIIFAIIIFLWIKSMIGEIVRKEIDGEKKTAQNLCENLKYDFEIINNELKISNLGNIPIYEIVVEQIGKGISEAHTYTIKLDGASSYPSPEDERIIINSYQYSKVKVTPVLLGNVGSKKKRYTCQQSLTKEI